MLAEARPWQGLFQRFIITLKALLAKQTLASILDCLTFQIPVRFKYKKSLGKPIIQKKMPFTLPSVSHCYKLASITLRSKPCISVGPFVQVTKSLNCTSACMQQCIYIAAEIITFHQRHGPHLNNLEHMVWSPWCKCIIQKCCIDLPACFCILCEIDTLHFNGLLDQCLSFFHQQQITGFMRCPVSWPLKGNLQCIRSHSWHCSAIRKEMELQDVRHFAMHLNWDLFLPYRQP